jgi:two-component system response regulator ChvI
MTITSRTASSLQPTTSMGDGGDAVRIVIVDDDELFRELLRFKVSDEGYVVTSFSSGSAALEHFAAGGGADVVLLDWCMPGMNGLEVLRRLRRAGNNTPVIFFTVLSEDIYQEAALENGAVDFIDKSRRLSIVMKRLHLVVEGARPIPLGDRPQRRDLLHLGDLELRFDTHRAIWAGTPIDLTLTEFKIVALLVQRTGEDVSYREIYDVVHGKGFAAGYGGEGYRPNVRTFITRIRVKFHDVDPGFQHIYNCAGFGYRWCAE